MVAVLLVLESGVLQISNLESVFELVLEFDKISVETPLDLSGWNVLLGQNMGLKSRRQVDLLFY